MNMCPLAEKQPPARIGTGDNLATSANDDTLFLWVLTDQDFVINSVLVTLHETEASARKWMLNAARGYLDEPAYEWGDLDDTGLNCHWEDRFWMKDICAMDISRKEVHK